MHSLHSSNGTNPTNSKVANRLNNMPPPPLLDNAIHFEAHEAFPGLTRALTLKTNKRFGTHIVGNDHIDDGKIVVATAPFASIEYLVCISGGCFACGKITESRIKCPNCIDVWFCRKRCYTSPTHKTKCNAMFDSSDCQIVRLATEIISVMCTFSEITTILEFCRGVLFWKKPTKNLRHPYSQYAEILSLKGPSDQPVDVAKVRRVVKLSMRMEKLKAVSPNIGTEEKIRILFSWAYSLVNSISLNTFSEQIKCSKGGALMRYSIFDFLSRFNHSCDPNLEHYIDSDEKTYCVTTKPIKPGEQLFINYLTNMEFESHEGRKQYLEETWNFMFKCPLCCT